MSMQKTRAELTIYGDGKLCEDCKRIGLEADSANGILSSTCNFLLKNSWNELRKSAEDGCECCRWFGLKGPNGERHADGTVQLVTPSSARDKPYVTNLQIYGEDSNGYRASFGEVQVYTDEDDPASCDTRIVQRSVQLIGGNKACMRFILDQLAECESHHEHCPDATLPALPSRVLDVSYPSLHDASVEGTVKTPTGIHTAHEKLPIRLVDSEGKFGRYLALSHCWGPPPQTLPMTTTKNFDARTKYIEFSELSKVFQDAVIVARRLGFTYIWIDALCIIQDSPRDWAIESSRMASIYRNATLCLAAALAIDSSIGFLQRRAWQQTACKIPLSSGRVTGPANIYLRGTPQPLEILKHHLSSPLHKRAWTYQERLLSTRMIFFDTYELLWECCEGRALESKRDLVEPTMNRKPSQFEDLTRYEKPILQSFKSKAAQTRSQRPGFYRTVSTASEDMYWRWYVLLYHFRQRALSYPDDALPAISGIAKDYANVLKDNYLAGIWEKNFRADLLWRTQPSSFHLKKKQLEIPVVRSKQAPSWSWASIASPNNSFIPSAVEKFTAVKDDHEAVLVTATIVPREKGAMFGQVESGRLELRGWHRPIYAYLKPEGHYESPANINVQLDDEYGFEVLAHFDEPQPLIAELEKVTEVGEDTVQCFKFDCFLLGTWQDVYASYGMKFAEAHCLILDPADQQEDTNCFQRVGTACIRPPLITDQQHKNQEWKRRGDSHYHPTSHDCPQYVTMRYENFDKMWDHWTECTICLI